MPSHARQHTIEVGEIADTVYVYDRKFSTAKEPNGMLMTWMNDGPNGRDWALSTARVSARLLKGRINHYGDTAVIWDKILDTRPQMV